MMMTSEGQCTFSSTKWVKYCWYGGNDDIRYRRLLDHCVHQYQKIGKTSSFLITRYTQMDPQTMAIVDLILGPFHECYDSV